MTDGVDLKLAPDSFDRSTLTPWIESRPHGLTALNDHFLRTPKPNLYFLFVEKVGCTYLKHMLLRDMVVDPAMFDAGYYEDGGKTNNLVHALAYSVLRVDGRDALANPDATFITFCRNPYARVISAYMDKIENVSSTEMEYFSWMRREILFDKGRRAIDGEPTNWTARLSVEDFVDFIGRQAPGARDAHWAEQHLLNLSDVLRPQAIINLERFDEVLPQLWRDKFNLDFVPLSASSMNSTSERTPMLTKRVARKVYDIYRKDFELYGYSEDSWEQF